MAKIAYASVAELLEDRMELTTFNNLLRRSGVIKEIDGRGPYTVIAPTNDAFERLPEGTLGFMVNHPDRLRRLIEHHIVDGEYSTTSAMEPTSWPTLLGEPLSVMPAEDRMVIGSGMVIATDLVADNGLVHIIDTVLLAE